VEFLGKTIFQNFFRQKFQIFPTFLGVKFSEEFSPNFCGKIVQKSALGSENIHKCIPEFAKPDIKQKHLILELRSGFASSNFSSQIHFHTLPTL
jgi:hypothetical protein